MVFKQPRVAVIGAGLSGLVSAKHLKYSGIEVVVYERSSKAGGNWVYDERKAPEPKYPSVLPSEADAAPKASQTDEGKAFLHGDEPKTDDIALSHAPPGPAYNGLTTNVPTGLQELKGHPWPEVEEQFVNVRACGEYLQSYAGKFGVDELIKYNTRVERLEKVGEKWRVEAVTLVTSGPQEGERITSVAEFDKIVIANGHYHASKVPFIPGLATWKSTYPQKVQHSKSYRRPSEFKGQTVLLIGAGVSSTDIARELSHTASRIYQSSRNSPYDLPVEMLPSNATRIGEIASFDKTFGTANLKNGEVVRGIERVVVCTGYHFSLPFLKELHSDEGVIDEKVLVTDGTQMHNLHKDIFYIPDPSLGFIGVPFYTATFSFFEYQAIALAAVFARRAWLPKEEDMRAEYDARVKRKGAGRALHDMKGEEVDYVRELVGWVNEHAETTGGMKAEAHSAEWVARRGNLREEFLKFLVWREKRERERIAAEVETQVI